MCVCGGGGGGGGVMLAEGARCERGRQLHVVSFKIAVEALCVKVLQVEVVQDARMERRVQIDVRRV